MKKLLIIVLAFIGIATSSFAQSNKEDIDLLQAAIGKDKKTLFTEFMILEDGTKKDAFWKLYDEYEGKRKELGRKRLELLEKYANTYQSMSDADTEKSLNDIIKLADDNNTLIVTYTNKMKKPAGVKAAAQFYQLENYILSVVRATLLANIPVLGGKN